MTPLRIAFDMDGTLADLGSAFAEVEDRIFGAAEPLKIAKDANDKDDDGPPTPEAREIEQQAGSGGAEAEPKPSEPRAAPNSPRRRDRVWQTIESTPNFWTTLKPLEEGAVKRLYELTGELNWEVFFVTQRPATAGATVQLQTHQWLVEHGFSTPSVIPLSGGRGKAASALRLDYLIDDTPQNCVDVLADSTARAILLATDALAESSARRLGIGVAHSVHEVLDLLVKATAARANPPLFERLRKMVGWK
jgi:5'(3')-deoxyribonucleotidase